MSDEKRTQGGLSATTLLIAGVASATAAIVIPMLWRPGTVFAAAMTPIVVALVSETLRRPVPPGSTLAIFDFGGGTHDVALVRNDGATFTVVGTGGAEDLGGLTDRLTGR